MELRKIGFAAAVSAALITLPNAASANGRYPAAGQVAVDPSNSAHVVVRATYGLLSTTDKGGTWGWICEGAVGFGGNEDPMVGVTTDGTVLAGLFNGLTASHDKGCTWEFAGGDLAGKYATDLSVEKVDPSRAVAITSNGVSANQFLTQLWESVDNGATWTQAGVDLPSEFLGLNVDVAPSDTSRVYVSGRYGAPLYPGALLRSPDRGKTWEKLDIPGSDDSHLPYLSAVDPSNPGTLYLRLDGDPVDALLVSNDGGDSWSTAFESTGSLYGFALSPDGSTVYIGGGKDGLWRAPASTLAFQKVSAIQVRCLYATDEGLYACGDEFQDGFTVGLSKDEGATFQPFMHLGAPCGPLECGAGTTVPAKCSDAWGVTKLTIGAGTCGGGGWTSTNPPDPPTPEKTSSCGLGATATAGPGSAAIAGLLLLGASRLRRRRLRAR